MKSGGFFGIHSSRRLHRVESSRRAWTLELHSRFVSLVMIQLKFHSFFNAVLLFSARCVGSDMATEQACPLCLSITPGLRNEDSRC